MFTFGRGPSTAAPGGPDWPEPNPAPPKSLFPEQAQTDTLTGDGLEFSTPKPRIPRSPILGAVYCQRP